MHRDSSVNDARGIVQALYKGEKPFDGIDDVQRLAILHEILGGDEAGPLMIRRQVKAGNVEVSFASDVSDEDLVAVAAASADALARRLGSYDPSPAERARIEAEAENDWHPDQAACGMH